MKKQKRLILRLKLVFIITLILLNLLVFGVLGDKKLFSLQPVYAQKVSPDNIWQLVYQQLPWLPRENQYISNETKKVAENDTLIGRLIEYHIYIKRRYPAARLDWKLTLADYMSHNETIYETTYPGHDVLRENPLAGDRAAIAQLTRTQRNKLVEVLVNIFTPPTPGSNSSTTN